MCAFDHWREHRDEVGRVVVRARRIVPFMRDAAAWVGTVIVISAVAEVLAVWNDGSKNGVRELRDLGAGEQKQHGEQRRRGIRAMISATTDMRQHPRATGD
jgi:hypothetical protein